MGQTRGMSIVSESDEEVKMQTAPSSENSKLLIETKQNNKKSTDVDFFTDRDYYKIFLETSKEQETRLKKNSPFSGLKTWGLLRVIVKTNDDLRQEAFAMQLISQCD